MNVPPQPIALIAREGKGCQQYTFANVEQLQDWAARKPYRDERVLVMPILGKQFLAKTWMPAAEAAGYVRDLVDTEQARVEAANLMALQLLQQAEARDEACAFWFIRALSKLANTQPHMRMGELLAFAEAAMPATARSVAHAAAAKT